MIRYVFLIICFAFINITINAQKNNVVAKFGNEEITATEFKLRYELSPYIPEDIQLNKDSIKYDFLYSLIAEKVWATEAQELGISNSEQFNFFFKPIQDLFVRDELFKVEVKDKVKLTANDVTDGINKYPITIKSLTIVYPDSITVFNFYQNLNISLNVDSLLSSNQELLANSDEVEIKFGSLKDEEIENKIFNLRVNQYTEPIKVETGWALFYIQNRIYTTMDLNDQKIVDAMKAIIRDRKIEKRYNEYYKQLLTGFKTEINPESVKILFDDIWNRMKQDSTLNDIIKYFALDEADVLSIINSPTYSHYDKTLFLIHKKEIKIKDFLSDIAFKGFSVKELDSLFVMTSLNQAIKNYITEQVITEEGYKKKLQLTPEVMNNLNLWREKYLAQMYFKDTMDSIRVSDEDAFKHYEIEMQNKTNMKFINIRLITLQNLDLIAEILDKLRTGADFGEIIKPFGQTDSLVNILGETGSRPVISLGEIGQLALGLKLNKVYGPFQRGNSYSLMQVIQRDEFSDSTLISFESVKNQIKNNLRTKILIEKLNRVTANFAIQNDLKIYPDVLNNISTTNIPMFVHRFMGFGGRIAGMPLLTPFSSWINDVNKKEILP